LVESFEMSSPNLEYEEEFEFEDEFETAAQGETEDEGEFERNSEFEDEAELEGESEWEFEDEGEEFARRLRRAARGATRFVRQNQPLLRQLAQRAAPMVGTAIGGPMGGMLASHLAANLESEDEFEYEDEFESEWEEAPPRTSSQAAAEAEYMAAAAAQTGASAEGEAFIGAAVVASLSPADRAALRRILPHLIRGMVRFYRLLRRRRSARPAIRTIPHIVRQTARTIRSRAPQGRVSPATVGRIAAVQTRNVLSRPQTLSRVLRLNLAAANRAARPVQTRRTRY
jgi:hypothetical protein